MFFFTFSAYCGEPVQHCRLEKHGSFTVHTITQDSNVPDVLQTELPHVDIYVYGRRLLRKRLM